MPPLHIFILNWMFDHWPEGFAGAMREQASHEPRPEWLGAGFRRIASQDAAYAVWLGETWPKDMLRLQPHITAKSTIIWVWGVRLGPGAYGWERWLGDLNNIGGIMTAREREVLASRPACQPARLRST